MVSALCGDEGGKRKKREGLEMIRIICFNRERQMVLPSFYFVIPAFAGKLIARVTMESRKQMTKGL